jgi:hypothetical protein
MNDYLERHKRDARDNDQQEDIVNKAIDPSGLIQNMEYDQLTEYLLFKQVSPPS